MFFTQATYLVDCITDKTKTNKILNIGGPDDGLTMTAQGKLVRERGLVRRSPGSFRLHAVNISLWGFIHITGGGGG